MTNHTHLGNNDTASIENGSKIKVVKKYQNRGPFAMFYQNTTRRAFDEAGEAMLTLGKLATMVKTENQVYFKPANLIKSFNISRSTLTRHLLTIKKLGLMEPDPAEMNSIRGINLWRICPFIVWKGGREDLEMYLKKLPKDHVWLTKWNGADEMKESNSQGLL